MAVLIDTGILLRAFHRDDSRFQVTRLALRKLKSRREQLVTTLQNVSEFWNVCTRPSLARGGLGETVEEVEWRLRVIERAFAILPEPPGMFLQWKELVLKHRVLGVQVHDAKLIAVMKLNSISRILTFNERDFTRYTGITVITPEQLLT